MSIKTNQLINLPSQVQDNLSLRNDSLSSKFLFPISWKKVSLVAFILFSTLNLVNAAPTPVLIPEQSSALWKSDAQLEHFLEPSCLINSYNSIDSADMTKNPLLYQWQIALTPNAAQMGTTKRMQMLGKRIASKNIEKLTIPNMQSHTYVGWNGGKIETFGKKPLFSKEFGPCIAVLGRAYKRDSLEISYLSLNHVFTNSEIVRNTLYDLSDNINRAGKIEFFITGGEEISKRRFETIKSIINECIPGNKQVQCVIQDETFGIAELGNYYIGDQFNYFLGSASIQHVGFDVYGNPFQIINTKNEALTAISDTHDVVWLD